MEIVLVLAIGVLTGSGVWLLLRPRTFQGIMGLSPGVPQDLLHYADPMPQALVLTAIVIGFAMTALFLVVLLASRGMSGTDHVDGSASHDVREMP